MRGVATVTPAQARNRGGCGAGRRGGEKPRTARPAGRIGHFDLGKKEPEETAKTTSERIRDRGRGQGAPGSKGK